MLWIKYFLTMRSWGFDYFMTKTIIVAVIKPIIHFSFSKPYGFAFRCCSTSLLCHNSSMKCWWKYCCFMLFYSSIGFLITPWWSCITSYFPCAFPVCFYTSRPGSTQSFPERTFYLFHLCRFSQDCSVKFPFLPVPLSTFMMIALNSKPLTSAMTQRIIMVNSCLFYLD